MYVYSPHHKSDRVADLLVNSNAAISSSIVVVNNGLSVQSCLHAEPGMIHYYSCTTAV